MMRPAWIAENEGRKSPLNEWRMNGDDDRIMNARNVEYPIKRKPNLPHPAGCKRSYQRKTSLLFHAIRDLRSLIQYAAICQPAMVVDKRTIGLQKNRPVSKR